MPAIFIISILLLQGLLFLGHWFAYATIVVTFGVTDPTTLFVLQALFFALSLTFISANLIGFRYSNRFTRAFYFFSAYWIGLLYFLAITCGIFWIGANIAVAYGACTNLASFGALALVIALLTFFYGVVQASSTKIVSIHVKLPHLPQHWVHKKTVFFSDMHLGNVRGRGFAAKTARLIRRVKPEAVFIGGDLFDGVKGNNDKLVAPLRELHPPHGVYFVAGNHEEFRDKEGFLGAVRRAGIRVLDNEKIDLAGIQLVGVDYRDSVKKEDFAAILKKVAISRAHPSILLKHVPADLDVAEAAGISLNLSGHTHKGQMPPSSFVVWKIYGKFAYGLTKLGTMHSFTSSGVGTWGPPVRMGSRSEIIVVSFS